MEISAKNPFFCLLSEAVMNPIGIYGAHSIQCSISSSREQQQQFCCAYAFDIPMVYVIFGVLLSISYRLLPFRPILPNPVIFLCEEYEINAIDKYDFSRSCMRLFK